MADNFNFLAQSRKNETALCNQPAYYILYNASPYQCWGPEYFSSKIYTYDVIIISLKTPVYFSEPFQVEIISTVSF